MTEIPSINDILAIWLKDARNRFCAADGTGPCACGSWIVPPDAFGWRPEMGVFPPVTDDVAHAARLRSLGLLSSPQRGVVA